MTPLDFSAHRPPRRSWLRKTVWVFSALALAYGGLFALKHLGNATISVANRIVHGTEQQNNVGPSVTPIADDPEYALPDNDKNRLDIIVLGIRGKDDIKNGGLLTDTILLFSLDKKTNRASLVSIPRDLTVRITDDRKEKMNTAYAHYGIGGTKKLFSRILGVAIDNIIVADFDAFLSIVDTLGGVTVTLDKPFHESQQWGNEFSLPAGTQTLDGPQALYYARSRYSTSDFDRSRRQLQILMAIKEKATALSITEEPIKALALMTTIRKHIETDLNILDLGTIKDLLAQQHTLNLIKRYQLTTDNLLYEAKVNGIYELLPRDATLAHIKRFIQGVLTSTPLLPTPDPTSASSTTPTLGAQPTPTP